MTLSDYFMLKSLFDQQCCRTLTFALARLSCLYGANYRHKVDNLKARLSDDFALQLNS